ncbi:hypothetical protein LIA77_04180 [Sarocladium implicatum]|nr:hypothetical protein LIA77_04180 [Sarocladium implicatum]
MSRAADDYDASRNIVGGRPADALPISNTQLMRLTTCSETLAAARRTRALAQVLGCLWMGSLLVRRRVKLFARCGPPWRDKGVTVVSPPLPAISRSDPRPRTLLPGAISGLFSKCAL